MNTRQVLADHKSTENFVDELSKHDNQDRVFIRAYAPKNSRYYNTFKKFEDGSLSLHNKIDREYFMYIVIIRI